ncbi:hypothetical protein SAMN02745866_03510 [Alteromonadaceae bacterium Bs31]|nr:hypothetical protein SAMN02745866_03510 [Alteromonadaceae bacterium Bs31]
MASFFMYRMCGIQRAHGCAGAGGAGCAVSSGRMDAQELGVQPAPKEFLILNKFITEGSMLGGRCSS